MGSKCIQNSCDYNNRGECGANNPFITYNFSKVHDIWENCKDVPTKELIGFLLLDCAEALARNYDDPIFKDYFDNNYQRADIDDQKLTQPRIDLIKYAARNYSNEIISDASDLAHILD